MTVIYIIGKANNFKTHDIDEGVSSLERRHMDDCLFKQPVQIYIKVNMTLRITAHPDSKVHGTNMGPAWVVSAPDRPHVGPMNNAIWDPLLRESTGHRWIHPIEDQ